MLVGDELEFAISQYLDGHLSAAEVAVLEERLATDSEARQTLFAYQQLNDKLRSQPPVPEIDLDGLAAAILIGWAPGSGGVAHGVRPVWQRFRPGSAPSTAAGFSRWSRPIALAASLAIVVGGVALISTHSRNAPRSTPVIANVNGPQIEQSNGPIFAEVAIGAAPSVASNPYRSSDDVIDRPSIVLIDRADNPPPDLY